MIDGMIDDFIVSAKSCSIDFISLCNLVSRVLSDFVSTRICAGVAEAMSTFFLLLPSRLFLCLRYESISSTVQSLHSGHLFLLSHFVSLHDKQILCLSYFKVLILFLQRGHERGVTSEGTSACVAGAEEVEGVLEDILSG